MLRRWVWPVGLVVSLMAACGQTEAHSGSNSNWLRCSTDADCGDGRACACGVCAEECSGDAACAGDERCRSIAALACGEASVATACLPACTEDAECGDGLSCEQNTCLRSRVSSPPPPGELNMEIAAGAGFECVRRDTEIWCQGQNTAGELGQGMPSEPSAAPKRVALDEPTALASGSQHSCALRRDGRVLCWGPNANGEIGVPSAAPGTCQGQRPELGEDGLLDLPCQPLPQVVPDISDATGVAVSAGRSCALLADESVRCWGRSDAVSSWLTSQGDVVQVELAPNNACVVRSDGALGCYAGLPEFAEDWTDVERVALTEGDGTPLVCTIRVGGRVDCFGDNAAGERGLGFAGGPAPTADDPPAIERGAVALAIGFRHVCALMDDGTVWCWGSNDYGEAGQSTTATRLCAGSRCQLEPARVYGLGHATNISAGPTKTCALDTTARVSCWGLRENASSVVPAHVNGPWERPATQCQSAELAIAELIAGDLARASVDCTSDADCVEMDLVSPCFEACSPGPVSSQAASDVEARLATLSAEHCDSAAEATCQRAPIECGPRKPVACDAGVCRRWTDRGRDCDNLCACEALERARVPATTCTGVDLYINDAVSCATCDGSDVWLTIGNSGTQAFEGEVFIDAWHLPQPGEAPTIILPPRTSLSLSLAPGASSAPFPIAFDPGSAGKLVELGLSGATECDLENNTQHTTPPSPLCEP